MPSASTKVENPPANEGLDPFKRVLLILDKKVRNLEKRKLKLDIIKEKQDKGAVLEKDQQAAIDKYGEVIQNLEFAHDLQKQFNAISTDVEKMMKKQAKKSMFEKQLQEVQKMKEVLQLQGLLDNMGSDNVRKDFQTGKHGAIVLTEENLDQLDELYKLVSPTREGNPNYHEALSKASEHIVNLLDARDKPVVGTTYKELKELLDLISTCGYFEKAYQGKDEKKKEEGADETEFEVVNRQDVPHPDSEEVQASLPREVLEEPVPGSAPGSQRLSEEPVKPLPSQVTNMPAEADSFFVNPVNTPAVPNQQQQQTLEQQQQAAAAAAAFSRQRPFQEIVSSVQGSFNFLQESTIETEAKREFSPHMDPAVVAAHPMPPSQPMRLPASTTKPQDNPGYRASSYGEQSHLDTDINMPGHPTGSHDPATATTEQIRLSQGNTTQSKQDFTNTGFSQSSITHSLQTEDLFSGAPADSSAGNISHSVLGKGNSDSTMSQFEIPPQIPMPPGHADQSQDSQSGLSQPEKKGYAMNPNASEFQSLIYTQSEDQDEADDNNADNSNYQGSSSYSNNNYQNRDGRPGRGGSGFRNNRGGPRGGGNNMMNGFSRGGRNSNGGSYERSNNGGGNYQGYQPRNDYNRSEGYQGYGGGSNNFNNGGGFQKRGGPGGGYQRGGNRGNNRGGSGYSRGGPGGSYNNNNRGGGRGLGRPNFNQQQGTN